MTNNLEIKETPVPIGNALQLTLENNQIKVLGSNENNKVKIISSSTSHSDLDLFAEQAEKGFLENKRIPQSFIANKNDSTKNIHSRGVK